VFASLSGIEEKNSRHFLSQVEVKTKPDTLTFSRAWHALHLFPSSSDWFIALFASDVIG